MAIFLQAGVAKEYNKSMKKTVLIPFAIVFFIVVTTVLIILYGKGYRFGFDNGKPTFSDTGLLVTTSNPDGAQVFIDGHLTTSTNNTLNLTPHEYDVKISKDGYFTWEKNIIIHKEFVAKAEALLFPTAPKLESLTDTGLANPVVDPSFTKIAYTVSSQSGTLAQKKNGIYILDMGNRPILTLQSASQQIADDTTDTFSQANLTWSPDGRNLIAKITNNRQFPTTYLLDASGINQNPKDVTETLATYQATWQKDKDAKELARMNTLKPTLKKFVAENFGIIGWSVFMRASSLAS